MKTTKTMKLLFRTMGILLLACIPIIGTVPAATASDWDGL